MTLAKTCPVCTRQFDAHPSAIYCSLSCVQRAKRRRRLDRIRYKLASPEDSPTQSEYTNMSGALLTKVYADIITHAYEKDIKLTGTIPEVHRPPDVILTKVPGTNYHIAYHKIRAYDPTIP